MISHETSAVVEPLLCAVFVAIFDTNVVIKSNSGMRVCHFTTETGNVCGEDNVLLFLVQLFIV